MYKSHDCYYMCTAIVVGVMKYLDWEKQTYGLLFKTGLM